MMKIPELLAPVGSSEHLKTAILSGASSIYLSGEEFGARKYAENFNLAEIREAVKYAHFYNVKVYVTVNILIKERELKRVSEYLLELYKIGVDAVLVQDIGLVKFINENIPKLAVHASTQMNIHNIEGVNWAYKHNIKRIVLPRECRLDEVRELINHAHSMGIEVEIFAHGALCYSYSGHCLLSSFQGGRSGNRGTCAQPCREQYELSVNKNKIVSPKTEGNYLLSPRDLSLYENLNEIINLEVDSIKIEGRMRSNEYVATVVSNYRQRLNSLRHDKLSKTLNRKIDDLNHSKNRKGKQGKNSKLKKAKDKEFISRLKNEEREKNRKSMEELELVFNREFTTGHLIPKNRQNIMNRKKPGHSGLYIGNIHRYNEQTGEIHISLNDDLIYIPEKGDGLLIEVSPSENKEEGRKRKTKKDKGKLRKSKMNKKSEERSNEQKGKSYNFGFDISSNPTLRDPKDKHWIKRPQDKDVTHRILIVKKVRENGRINIPLTKGSKVYLTKRNSLMKEIKELSKNVEKHSYKKSILELYFRIDSENYPHLKGNLKLDNGKVITLSHKGDEAWEEAINKPISNETIRKQLIKIGNLPYYIEKITVNNNKKLFAPISKINELRRNFFDQLEEEVKKSYLPKENDIKEAEAKIKSFNEKRLNKTASSNIKEEMISNNIKEEMSSNNIKEEMISSNPDEKDAPLSNEDPHSDKKNMNLAIYINNLKILKQINNLKLKDGKSLYDRVYLEIPPERDFEKVSKENIDNYNPIKANELNISYCQLLEGSN